MSKKTMILFLFFFVVSVGFYVPSVWAETETITIQTARVLAVQNSPEVKQAQNKIDQAYRTEIIKKQEKDSAHTMVVSTPSPLADAYEIEYKMKKKLWQYAQDELSDAQVLLENTQEKVKYSAENQYLTILNLQNQWQVLEASWDLQVKLAGIENLKYRLGLSTLLAWQQAQEKVEATQNSLSELDDLLTTLSWNFNRLLGREVNAPFRLSAAAFSPVDFNLYREEGLQQAWDASLPLTQLARLWADKKEDRDDLKPGTSDQSLLLEAELSQLEMNMESLRYGIEAGMKQAWEKMELAQKKLLTAKSNYRTQELNCTYQEQQYLAGLVPQILLDTGQLELKQAAFNYEKAVYDYYLATRELEMAQRGIS